MPIVNLLSDVDPIAVSLVKRGANRQMFFLRKSEGLLLEHDEADAEALIELPGAGDEMIHKSDWSAVYCVVAAPGTRELPGVLAKQGDPEDEWESEDQIRVAAHRFMKNGGLINRMHEDLKPYGQVVENAVAPVDFTIDGSTIKKGSWYIAIEPTDEGRKAIEDGEFTGVSLQGTGSRTAIEVEKAADPAKPQTYGKCDSCGSKVKRGLATCPNCGGATGNIQKLKADPTPDVPITNKPGVSNYIERGGGLPRLIRKVAEDLKAGPPPRTDSRAIQLAIGIVKNWSHGHDGKGHKVKADTQAKATAAMVEYNALPAKARAKAALKKETTMNKLAVALAKTLGVDPDAYDDDADIDAEVADLELDADAIVKSVNTARTFGDIVAERKAYKEVPKAMDAMHSAVHNHFFPFVAADGAPQPAPTETRKHLVRSLNEFHKHMVGLHDGIASGDIKKSAHELADELATLGDNLPNGTDTEENEMADDTKIEKLEGEIADIKKSVDTLAASLGPVIEKVKESETPKLEDVQKSLGDVTEKVAGIAKAVERLGEGGSKQSANGDNIEKSTDPLAGILA